MIQDYKEKVKITKNSIFTIIFVVLAVSISALIASGLNFTLEVFKDISFYVNTIIDFVIVMFVFSIIKNSVIQNEKRNEQNDYYTKKTRYENLLKFIHKHHLQKDIEEVVAEENEKRRKDACQKLLDQVSFGLKLEDMIDFTNHDFLEHCQKYKLSKREKRKLKRAIKKALNSKVKYDKISVSDVLIYNDVNLNDKNSNTVLSINSAELARQENLKKALTFLIMSAFTKALLWEGLSPQFLVMLLAQASLITSSIISATMTANARLVYLSTVLENRSNFINRNLDTKLKLHNNQNDL